MKQTLLIVNYPWPAADVASMRQMAKGRKFTVIISLGAGEAMQRDIVEVADKALYASKDGGHNRVTVGALRHKHAIKRLDRY